MNHQLQIVVRCTGCDVREKQEIFNQILKLSKSYTLQELIDYNLGDFKAMDNIFDTYKIKIMPKSDITVMYLAV